MESLGTSLGSRRISLGPRARGRDSRSGQTFTLRGRLVKSGLPHRLLNQAHHSHDDGSAYSTTRNTADDTLQIGASSSGYANSQSVKDARTGTATDDARYGVTYRAQTIFLHRRARDIATNGAAD